MKNVKKIIAIINACLAASLMLMSQASYAVDAGHAQFVSGNVRIRSANGQERILKKGDVVREGDTLTTATAASAQIKMLDGGLIAVRSDTKLKFDTFKFNGTQDGSERSFFLLFTGGFRAVTGLIGKLHKSSFHITTTAAVIGIRGTDHETYVVTAGSPMAAVAPIGTYNKVNWGETTMTTDRGTVSILPNQMGYVSAADQMPELKALNTNIFTKQSWPLIKVKAGKKEDKQVRKTAAADKSGKKEMTAEAVTSAGKKNGKEVKEDKQVLKTSAADKSGKKEMTVEAATSAGRKNGKEVHETVTDGNTSKKNTATLVSDSGKSRVKMSPTGRNATTTPSPVILPPVVGISVLPVVIIDPVSVINWGRWNDSIPVTSPVTGEVTTITPKLHFPLAAGPAGIAGNAGPTETGAVAPDSGNNTHSNAQGTGAALANNPNTVGANQNGSASQLLTIDNPTFTFPNNSNGLSHRRSGGGITP